MVAIVALLLTGSASAGLWIAQGGDEAVTIGGFPIIIQQLQDDYQHIIGKIDVLNDNVNYRIVINELNELCFQYSSNNAVSDVCSSVTLSNNTLYNFGVVNAYEGSNAGRVLIYLNGSLVANESFIGARDTNTNPLTLGRTSAGTGQYIGMMDNIRLYNKALAGTNIAAELARSYAEEGTMLTYDFENTNAAIAFDTHLGAWDSEYAIVMANGSYDSSEQCVLYQGSGDAYIQNNLVRLIINNAVLIAALMLFVGLAAWWVWS